MSRSNSSRLRTLAFGCLGGLASSAIGLYTFTISQSCVSLVALAIIGSFILQLISVITTLVLIAGLNDESQHVKSQLQSAKIRELHHLGTMWEHTIAMKELRRDNKNLMKTMEQHTFSLQSLETEIHNAAHAVQEDVMIMREIVANLGGSLKRLDSGPKLNSKPNFQKVASVLAMTMTLASVLISKTPASALAMTPPIQTQCNSDSWTLKTLQLLTYVLCNEQIVSTPIAIG